MSPLGDGRVGYIRRHTGPIGWSLSVTSADLLPARKIRRCVMEQPLRSGPFEARRTVSSVTTLAYG